MKVRRRRPKLRAQNRIYKLFAERKQTRRFVKNAGVKSIDYGWMKTGARSYMREPCLKTAVLHLLACHRPEGLQQFSATYSSARTPYQASATPSVVSPAVRQIRDIKREPDDPVNSPGLCEPG
jgi:hypothetical protein